MNIKKTTSKKTFFGQFLLFTMLLNVLFHPIHAFAAYTPYFKSINYIYPYVNDFSAILKNNSSDQSSESEEIRFEKDEIVSASKTKNVQKTKNIEEQTNFIYSNDKFGIIGYDSLNHIDDPSDNIFSFELHKADLQNAQISLVANVKGISNPSGLALSVNEKLSTGGYLIKSDIDWQEFEIPLAISDLKLGTNHFMFTLPEGISLKYEIKDVKLKTASTSMNKDVVLVDGNSLIISNGKAYVKGFLKDANSVVFINGIETVKQGSYFEIFLDIPSNSSPDYLDIKIVNKHDINQYKHKINRILNANSSISFNLPKAKNHILEKDNFFYEINSSDYKIILNKEDYKEADKIYVQPLRTIDVPALGSNIINTTNGSSAYRFLPDGIEFENEVGLTLKYDKNKIPKGYSEKDLKILYFDIDQRRWLSIKTDTINFDENTITGLTNHFTDYISGIIQAPESPESNSFTPTSISGIEVANPTANIFQVQPPTANQKGDGTIQFPLTIPPARAGLQPSLALTYNNNGSSSFVGYGWDLSIPSISVDVKLGVPPYDSFKETESYLMNGEELLLKNGNRLFLPHRQNVAIDRISDASFFPKIEGSFSKIERRGDMPSNYYWLVTDKSGTKYYYGENSNSKFSSDENSGNIAKWMLTRVEDKNGNYITYEYITKYYSSGNLAGGKEILISSITYGLNTNIDYDIHFSQYNPNGYYKIEFFYKNDHRTDQTINYRYGFKEVNSDYLDKIEIYSGVFNGKRGEFEINYKLNYDQGVFSKQLLTSIETINKKNPVIENNWESHEQSYVHKFEYYNDIQNGLFGAEQSINTHEDIETRFSSVIGTTIDEDIQSGDIDLGFGVFGPALPSSYIPFSYSGTFNLSYPFPSTYRSKQDLMLIDIDGDGLPDKVFKKNKKFKYRKNLGGNMFSSQPLDLVNFQELSLTRTHTDNKLSPSLSLSFANVNFSSNSITSETSIFLTDVNADGLVDYVKDGKVYFNRIDPNSGLPTFTTNSLETPNVIFKEGDVAPGVLNEMPDLNLGNDLMDVVKVWVAPKNGAINISGTISKDLVGLENGIRYSIEKSSNTIRFENVDRNIDDFGVVSGLTTPITLPIGTIRTGLQSTPVYIKQPTLMLVNSQQTNFNNISVKKGDMIFFRVNSSQIQVNQSIANWDPEITYTTNNFDSPNQYKQYSSKYSDSFIFGNAISEPLLIDKNGIYNLKWDSFVINNLTTIPELTDDVVVKIYLYKQIVSNQNIIETGVYPTQTSSLLSSFNIKRDINNTFSSHNQNLTITDINAENPESYIYFKIEVESKSQIDWKKFDTKFVPQLKNLSNNEIFSIIPTYEVYKNQITDYYKSTFVTNTSVRINNNFVLPNCNESNCNNKYIYFIAKNQNGKVPKYLNNPLKFRYKISSNGNVIEKKQYSDLTNAYSIDIINNSIDIIFPTGSMFFEYYTDDSALANNLSTYQIDNNLIYYTSGSRALSNYVVGQSNNGLYRANIFFRHNMTGFGTLYRNWGQFAYKGAKPEEEFEPIKRKYLGLSKLVGLTLENPTQEEAESQNNFFINTDVESIEYDYEQETLNTSNQINLINRDQIEAFKHFTMFKPNRMEKIWESHEKLYVGSKDFSPYLRYSNNGELETIDIETPQLPGRFGAYAIKRLVVSSSKGKNISAGFGPVSLGHATNSGKTKILNNYQDINGDGYPDIIGSKVQLTSVLGGLSPRIMNYNLLFDSNTSGSGTIAAGSSSTNNVLVSYSKNESRVSLTTLNGSAGINGSLFTSTTKSPGMLVDVNGDGLTDQVLTNNQVLLNTGSQFVVEPFLGFSDSSLSISKSGALGLGLTGGLQNIVGEIKPVTGEIDPSAISNFDLSFGVSKNNSHNTQNVIFVDVNGDGLPDYVNDREIFINTGTSFKSINRAFPKFETNDVVQVTKNINASISVLIPLLVLPIGFKIGGGGGKNWTTSYNLETTKFMDFDGDGYIDVVHSTNENELKVQLSNIRRTNMLQTVINPTGSQITLDYGTQSPITGVNFGSNYKMPFKKWVLTKVTIHDGFKSDGADIQTLAFEYANGLKDRRERKFLGFGEVRTHQLKSDGSVYRTSVTQYLLNSMPNSHIYLPGSSSDSRKYQYTGDLVRSQYTLDGAKRLLSSTYNDYAFFDLSRSSTVNQFLTANPLNIGYNDVNRILPLLKSVENTVYHYKGNGNDQIKTQNKSSFISYDKYGNVTEFKDDIENLKVKISYHNLVNDSIYIVNIPKSHIVSWNGVELRKSSTELNDQFNIGKIVKSKTFDSNNDEESIIDFKYNNIGNLINVIYPKSFNDERMFYEYEYEPQFNQYVHVVKDAYGFKSSTEYTNFGMPTKVTDINNVQFNYTYDATRRLEIFKGPYNEEWTIKNEYGVDETNETNELSPSGIYYAITKHNLIDQETGNNNYELHTASFADGLGRILQTKKQLENRNQCGDQGFRFSVSGQVIYDEFGRAVENYLGQEEMDCSADFDTALRSYTLLTHTDSEKTSTFYDMQDRVIQNHVYGLNATTRYDYGFDLDGFNQENPYEMVILPEGNTSMTFKDYKGRVTTTRQIANDLGETLDTKYEYSPLNELLRVIDAQSQVTSYQYDSFGQKISVKHPDSGESTFKYDLSGKLIESANQVLINSNESIKYEYNFNQLVKIEYPSHTVKYSYGAEETPDFTIGRLNYVSDLTGERFFKYGKLGEVTNEKRIINSQNSGTLLFDTYSRFDSWGRILEMTYPDGEHLKYDYNSVGQLKRIYNRQGQVYLADVEYTFFDQPKRITYGNNVQTINEYDITQRIRAMQLNRPDYSSFMRTVYSYDRNQNITNLKNRISQHSILGLGGVFNKDYKYDQFNRLAYANGNWNGEREDHSYELKMQYNQTHGILEKDQLHVATSSGGNQFETENSYIANYEYKNEEHPHAVSSIYYFNKADNTFKGDMSFKYDANGNIDYIDNRLEENSYRRRFIWDEQNRLQLIDENDGEKISHYVYDHTGERTFKAEGNSSTIAIGGQSVHSVLDFNNYVIYPSGNLVLQPSREQYTKHYYINNKKIASRVSRLENYLFRDNRTSFAKGQQTDETNNKPIENIVEYDTQDNQYTIYSLGRTYTATELSDCQDQLNELLQQYHPSVNPNREHCYKFIIQQMNLYPDKPCDALIVINRYTCIDIATPTPDPTAPVYEEDQILEADCYNNLIQWLNRYSGLPQSYFIGEKEYFYCYSKWVEYVNESFVLFPKSNACAVYQYIKANFDCEKDPIEIEDPIIPDPINGGWVDNGGNNNNPSEPVYDESLRVPIWWYHTDHLGSSSYITDNFGRPSHYYDQLPFGESMVEHNQSSYYNNGYKFNGKELDEATGMYYYGARYYDPRISIFISVDPAAEEYPGIGGYVYVANNPINAVDPDGKRIVYIIKGNKEIKDQSFIYKNGNFYNSKNNKIFIPDEKKQATMFKVWQSYRKIEASDNDVLKGQLKTIQDSDLNHYVGQSPYKSNSVSPIGGALRNEEGNDVFNTYMQLDFNANSKDPFEIVVHELRHQFDFDIGNTADEIKRGDNNDPMEIRATYNENIARKINGKKPLDSYKGKKIDPEKLKNPPNNIQAKDVQK